MIHLWGIPQCGTVRKALKALEAADASFVFHNLDEEPPAEAMLRGWIAAVGRVRLMNPSSRDWRTLDAAQRDAAKADDETALSLLLRSPRICRRPVVLWPDGAVTSGYADFEKQLCALDAAQKAAR